MDRLDDMDELYFQTQRSFLYKDIKVENPLEPEKGGYYKAFLENCEPQYSKASITKLNNDDKYYRIDDLSTFNTDDKYEAIFNRLECLLLASDVSHIYFISSDIDGSYSELLADEFLEVDGPSKTSEAMIFPYPHEFESKDEFIREVISSIADEKVDDCLNTAPKDTLKPILLELGMFEKNMSIFTKDGEKNYTEFHSAIRPYQGCINEITKMMLSAHGGLPVTQKDIDNINNVYPKPSRISLETLFETAANITNDIAKKSMQLKWIAHPNALHLNIKRYAYDFDPDYSRNDETGWGRSTNGLWKAWKQEHEQFALHKLSEKAISQTPDSDKVMQSVDKFTSQKLGALLANKEQVTTAIKSKEPITSAALDKTVAIADKNVDVNPKAQAKDKGLER